MTTCSRCRTPLADGAGVCAACGLAVPDPAAITASVPAVAVDELLAALRRDLAQEYDLEGLVGHGGMAAVYRGVERELHRQVAIKVLPLGTSPDLAERFRREARVAASLDHANVIPIYRVGKAAGTYFFAMKFIDGRALDAIIERQGALSLPVTLHVLRGVLTGLAYAHEREVVHRDIKGANVLIDRDGRVLLADLGIARAREERGLTDPGSVLGTPEFMSPEQCAGQPAGPQSDQYAVGILAFQMLTGQLPFDSETLVGMLHHHILTPPPEIAGVRDDLPETLVAIVRRALAKEPAGRFATTGDMLRAVEAVPLTAYERQHAEEDLKRLAQGEPLPTVRTASVPPPPSAASQATVPTTPAPHPLTEPRRSVSAVPPPATAPRMLGIPAEGPPPPVPSALPAALPPASPRPAPARPVKAAGRGATGPIRKAVGGLGLVAVGAVAAVLVMRRIGGPGASPPVAETVAAAPTPVDTAALRDSLRAADSLRVADSIRVADSLRVADSVRVADSIAAAAPTGAWVRLLGDLPDDAVFWFNGRPRRGRFLAVPPGRYTLEVETSEFEPWESEIVVRRGDTLRVRVELELKSSNP